MSPRIALITTLLVLALAAPAGARRAPSARSPRRSRPRRRRPPTPTTDDGKTGRDILFRIGGALIVGFGVMGWFILRDARCAVPEARARRPAPA